MEYLQFEDIVLINEMTIEQHGGNFVPPNNFLHEEALHYVLDSVAAEMFSAPLYPTIPDKAAVYLFSIISNHIFSDGNKRTGLEAALLFLKLNHYYLQAGVVDQQQGATEIQNDELYDFTIAVASGERNLDEVRAWFMAHAREL